MDERTLAEVLCNLAGFDPNDDEQWQWALRDAKKQLQAAERGEIDAWWEE